MVDAWNILFLDGGGKLITTMNSNNSDDPMDAEISCFDSVRSSEPSSRITIRELIDDMKSGRFRQLIEPIRDSLANGDTTRAYEGKAALPCVTLSGLVTSGGRSHAFDDDRFKHSGWMQVDLDGKDLGGRNPVEVRNLLSNDPHFRGVALSPSGTGVKALCRIPVCGNGREHMRAFLLVEKYTLDTYGFKIDPSTKDSARLLFVTYDPEIIIPEEPAKVLPMLPDIASEKKHNTHKGTAPQPSAHTRKWTADEVREMLKVIPTRPEYNGWLTISSAVWSELGVDGTPLLIEWSPEKELGEYDKKFKDRLTQIRIGTLIRLATKNGWKRPFKRDEREQSETPPEFKGFPIVRAGDSAGYSMVLDFVESLLTEGGVSMVYGPSNCGKTFWILDLGAAVAMGRKFRGELETDQGAVIYIALEGTHGAKNRIEAMKRKGLIPDDAPLFLCFAPISLLDDGHAEMLTETVKEAASLSSLPCRLVIIDTMARAMSGGDENSGKDMALAVASIDAVRKATDAHVTIVHHSGKEMSRGARGHSSLRAAVDTEIQISRPDGIDESIVRVTKQRDLPIGPHTSFKLEPVELGTDRRGKPITSCVVVHRGEHQEKKRGRPPKASDWDLLRLLPQPSTGAWENAALGRLGIKKSAFHLILKSIKASGLAIYNPKHGWQMKVDFRTDFPNQGILIE